MAVLELRSGINLKGIDYSDIAVSIANRLTPLSDEDRMEPNYDAEQIAQMFLSYVSKQKNTPLHKDDVMYWGDFVRVCCRHIKSINGIWSYRHNTRGWVKLRLDRVTPEEAQNNVFKTSAEVVNRQARGLIRRSESTNLLTGHNVSLAKHLEDHSHL